MQSLFYPKKQYEFHHGHNVSPPKEGLSIVMTSLFIVGEMAGGGIVAMPGAMAHASWYGILLLVSGAIFSGYTGMQLGWCWTMLQEMWPKYQLHTGKPYQSIGQRAFGKPAKYFVSLCIYMTLYGATILFTILWADEVYQIADEKFDKCKLMVIFVAFITPFSFLGSPAEFWWVSIGAMVTSSFACILIVAGAAIDSHDLPFNVSTTAASAVLNSSTVQPYTEHSVHYPPPSALSFFSAYAAITFAYGGHSAFPTMQHDMKRPSDFGKAVILGYIAVAILYFPVALVAYALYGDLIMIHGADSNITSLIGTDWIRKAISGLIAGHVTFGVLITVNVVNQDIETTLKIPHEFGISRVISRTLVMLLALFIAVSVPNFGPIMDLIGSSSITSLTYIMPCICFLRLKTLRKVWVEYA